MEKKGIYRLDTECYNEKRYGRPYIGLCGSDGRVIRWGTWIGDKGDEGELELTDISYGDLIIQGQKDYRGNNSKPQYGVVVSNFDVEFFDTKIQAIRFFRRIQKEIDGGSLSVADKISMEAK